MVRRRYIITARSYRYRGEAAVLQPDAVTKWGNPAGGGDATGDSPFGGTEPARYAEVPLDNFNYYDVQYSDNSWAIEIYLSVNYGVVDLYTNFDVVPTQSRYFQRASGVYRDATILVPFGAHAGAIGHVYFGIFARETDYSNYHVKVRTLNYTDSVTAPSKLVHNVWRFANKNAEVDGYRFYRSYVGPEDTPMGHTVRSSAGKSAANVGADPYTWGNDWTEDWVATWVQQHRAEMDFDVDATFTIKVDRHPLPDLGGTGRFV